MPLLDARVDYILGKHLEAAFEEMDKALELYPGSGRASIWLVLDRRPELTDYYDGWEANQ